ncbi:DMT family transporter [Crenobacter sp. SG2303]|uniref:DMT family transporter n=1 Tax=Crenobacter oryzisoli TaxID=3056844 RepID=A0ABT7XSG8_9NEIS|nr:DMT family transporter [Crenobacter sp. SG2303]MDN0076751.1 DMT family transporter [Crenobacter sp. SG2303]
MSSVVLSRAGHSPLALLIGTGSLLGAGLLVVKLATSVGVAPLGYAFWSSLLAGALLLSIGRLPTGRGRELARYSVLMGGLSLLPNCLTYLAIPHLGTGYAALLYTLPTLFTWLMALAIGWEKLSGPRALAVGLGVAGAVLVLSPRLRLAAPAEFGWLLVALGSPLFLALCNLLRKRYLPKGIDNAMLAGSQLLAGALTLLPWLLFSGGLVVPVAGMRWLALQVGLSVVASLLYFQLQKLSSPVFLSQLGYVIMLSGLAGGALLFGDWPALATLLGVPLLYLGARLLARG